MSLFYPSLPTPPQDPLNPHQVLSQREDGSHRSPAVLRKAMTRKEQLGHAPAAGTWLVRQPL